MTVKDYLNMVESRPLADDSNLGRVIKFGLQAKAELGYPNPIIVASALIGAVMRKLPLPYFESYRNGMYADEVGNEAHTTMLEETDHEEFLEYIENLNMSTTKVNFSIEEFEESEVDGNLRWTLHVRYYNRPTIAAQS